MSPTSKTSLWTRNVLADWRKEKQLGCPVLGNLECGRYPYSLQRNWCCFLAIHFRRGVCARGGGEGALFCLELPQGFSVANYIWWSFVRKKIIHASFTIPARTFHKCGALPWELARYKCNFHAIYLMCLECACIENKNKKKSSLSGQNGI